MPGFPIFFASQRRCARRFFTVPSARPCRCHSATSVSSLPALQPPGPQTPVAELLQGLRLRMLMAAFSSRSMTSSHRRHRVCGLLRASTRSAGTRLDDRDTGSSALPAPPTSLCYTKYWRSHDQRRGGNGESVARLWRFFACVEKQNEEVGHRRACGDADLSPEVRRGRGGRCRALRDLERARSRGVGQHRQVRHLLGETPCAA